MNVRDAFFEVLRAHGITTIFGNPGSNELPLLREFPADLGNLTNTQSGHVPLVLTSGQQARRYTALNAMLTNVDAPMLVDPLVKWSSEPLRPEDLPQALSKAILLSCAAPAGPVYLSLPLDDWDHDADVCALELLKLRRVHGAPVVSERSLGLLRDQLATAENPVMIVGPDVDDPAGWEGGTRLAEQLSMPVLIAPSPSRCPFPTRHPSYRGILPTSIPEVARQLQGHDVAVAFGTAIFRYHEFIEGDYLPSGTEFWAVTSDPDEAARAPFGQILIGDPSDALTRLSDTVPAAGRPALTPRDPAAEANEAGPAFSAEAILDALNAAKDGSTVIAHEWTSADVTWDRLDISRPGSLFFPAAGGLGWGLPAAIGLQLGDPSRRVLAVLGDGALHYTVSGLWTAAKYSVPVVFVVCRNGEYAALKKFTQLMKADGVPALELPDIDISGIAASYGIAATQVNSLAELTRTVKRALAGDTPQLIEVPQQRLAIT